MNIRKKLADFFEAAMARSLTNFYEKRDVNYINFNAGTQALVRKIYMDYRTRVADNKPLPHYREAGFSIYSQYDEDGLILYIFGVIGFKTYRFVDIGAGDCMVASNTANLVNNFGFDGVFIDGEQSLIDRGRAFYENNMMTAIYPPKFVCSQVTRENINQLIGDKGFSGEIDFLTIDIDGNDYWIWEALDVINPRVVVIENHVEFGMNNVVVPYQSSFRAEDNHPDYNGASPVAFHKLARRKGYHLVATNIYGFNTFYLRNDLATALLPEIPVEKVLEHQRNAERIKLFEGVKNMPFEVGK